MDNMITNFKGDEGISPLKVCHSNAGYYIGRTIKDSSGYNMPYSRESVYFKSQKIASDYLLCFHDFEMEMHRYAHIPLSTILEMIKDRVERKAYI
tara:strand:- start:471 stop:755 length:285 start_codon:yes stop_codon:yes gene_type:complete